jgi:hypothetical protein
MEASMTTECTGPGRSGRALSPDYIRRLQDYRRGRGLSVYQLKLAMNPDEGKPPFKAQTLVNALQGKLIQKRNWRFITEWIDRIAPASTVPVVDGKSAAAGERA